MDSVTNPALPLENRWSIIRWNLHQTVSRHLETIAPDLLFLVGLDWAGYWFIPGVEMKSSFVWFSRVTVTLTGSELSEVSMLRMSWSSRVTKVLCCCWCCLSSAVEQRRAERFGVQMNVMSRFQQQSSTWLNPETETCDKRLEKWPVKRDWFPTKLWVFSGSKVNLWWTMSN